MRILITNDDGVYAPGLALLAEAAASQGEVTVVAPDTEQSGVSCAITLHRPLRLNEINPGWWSCDGTPSDCVYLGIHQMKLKPDVVLSGLNPGPNLGHDVLQSGTVGGAIEAARWGIGALAFSYADFELAGMKAAAQELPGLLERLLPLALEHRIVFNVNLPPVDRRPWGPVRFTRTGDRRYSNEIHERHDPRGSSYYWIGGETVTMADIPGTDCNAIRDGQVSVTPLDDDLTNGRTLSLLQNAGAPAVPGGAINRHPYLSSNPG